jgi:hypothetical protein
MPGTKMKLGYEITGESVLPEILSILEEMIRLYNDFQTPNTYLKLNGPQTNTSITRYETYESKNTLLVAIKNNCPQGCKLVNI